MSEAVLEQELLDKSTEFARELSDLICAVLDGSHQPFEVLVSGAHVIIRQSPADGLLLTVAGLSAARLRVRFRCTWDSRRQYLAVNESTVAVVPSAGDEPLYHYDYIAEGDGRVPSAHLNVHGHRDDFVFALMAATRKNRGKAREAAIRKGRVPTLATFHFPVGGHRFRPAVEDVLEITIREFDIDVREGWESAIRAGRARWRDKQLRAAVRDDPAAAAEVLRSLHFAVTDPEDVSPKRVDRIESL